MALRDCFSGKRRTDIAVAVFLVALYLSLALYTLPATGLTIDEPRYIAQAKARAYSIYATATGSTDLFFCDLTKSFIGTEWYSRCWEGRPKLAITLSGIGWAAIFAISGVQLGTIESIAAHRIPIILFSALGLLVLYLLVRDGYGRRAAFFSGLSFIFMPVLFSFTKYVLIDGVSAMMWIICVWVFWKATKSRKYALMAGPVFGIAMTSKAQLWFLPIALIVWVLVSYRDRLAVKAGRLRSALSSEGSIFYKVKSALAEVPLPAYSIAFLSPVFALLLWPWLWFDTAERFSWWVSYYTGATGSGAATSFFMGEAYTRAPFFFQTLLSLATLPVTIMTFSLIGAYAALKHTANLENRLSLLVLLSATLLLVVFSLRGISYSGVQQYIQIFPFIAILSGIGADRLLSSMRKSKQYKKREILILAAVALLIALPGLVSILNGHTDSYFSVLVGGTGGVYSTQLFEPVWSGEPYLETVPWMNENLPQNSSIYVPMFQNIFNTYKYGDIGQITGRVDTSSVTGFSFEQDGILREDIEIISFYEYEEDPSVIDRVNYIVTSPRFSSYWMESFMSDFTKECIEDSEPVYRVVSYGAPIASVYEFPCR